jgi:hypothetical protein
MLTTINDTVERMSLSKILTPRAFHRLAFIIGISGPIFFAIAVAAPVFLPPIPPSWDADQIVQHYREHRRGIQASSACFVLAGAGFSTAAAFISDQLTRIPNLPHAVAIVEQTGGNCIGLLLMMCGVILATAGYRLDRQAEITQTLNDMFWLCFGLPVAPFLVQLFALTWAVLVDTRPKPYFPKYLAIVNVLTILIGIPSLVMHVFYDGPLAWNGAINFWSLVGIFAVQQVIEWSAIWVAISSETEV